MTERDEAADGTILAAGCVLWRRAPGRTEQCAPEIPVGQRARGAAPEARGAVSAGASGGPPGGLPDRLLIELALVHRPKWQDWSHPKGKLKRGEDALRAAVREVREETGMTCAVGPELPTAEYRVDGRPKRVRYWAAEATGGSFEPNSEVDRLLWVAPDDACGVLTQGRDRELVEALLSVLRAGG